MTPKEAIMCDDQELQPDDELEDEPQEEFIIDPNQPVILICMNCMEENEEIKLRSVQNNRCWNCGCRVDPDYFPWRP